MKFVYVDETGDKGQTDVLVMTGLLIDAYLLRKYTASFDEMLTAFLARHPGSPKELKTKAFINGSGGWSKIDHAERKKFLENVCDLAAECSTIFAVAFSFENFEKATNAGHCQPFKSYWLAAAMFIAALVQKQMKKKQRNKGHTVFICDDNQREMSNFSDALYKANPWFDPIYQTSKRKKSGKTVWCQVPAHERFDQIINTGFAVKSEHSSLIQVADAVSYAYRRHLELKNVKEQWSGEQQYFASLVAKFEEAKKPKKPKRERLGRTPGGPCIEFYKAACHGEWTL
jgi:Protein of unknown function (DUF3800)